MRSPRTLRGGEAMARDGGRYALRHDAVYAMMRRRGGDLSDELGSDWGRGTGWQVGSVWPAHV